MASDIGEKSRKKMSWKPNEERILRRRERSSMCSDANGINKVRTED